MGLDAVHFGKLPNRPFTWQACAPLLRTAHFPRWRTLRSAVAMLPRGRRLRRPRATHAPVAVAHLPRPALPVPCASAITSAFPSATPFRCGGCYRPQRKHGFAFH